MSSYNFIESSVHSFLYDDNFSCVVAQIRELEPVLCQAGRTSQLIWTSSSNAHRSAFSLEDIQHQGGTQPYSSSKYASDLLSVALNTHYNKQVGSHTLHMLHITCTCDDIDDLIGPFALQGLYSSVTCPGFVMTSLTYSILPSFPAFLWTLLMPVFWLVSVTLHGTNYLHMPAPPNLIFFVPKISFVSVFSWLQIRMFTNTFTLTPYNGAEALVCKMKF